MDDESPEQSTTAPPPSTTKKVLTPEQSFLTALAANFAGHPAFGVSAQAYLDSIFPPAKSALKK